MEASREVSIQFQKLPEVCRRVALSRSKVYALVAEGRFPRPHKIGRASVWLQSEVEAWMRAQVGADNEAG
jgi:prophage regulatory protein